MNLYFELLNKPVFSFEDVKVHFNSDSGAHAALKKMVDDKMVARIRRNCYTCINGKNGNPVADRYQIASSITNTSFISHHTAMEYHGFSNQIFYEVYVGSMTEFKSFEFDGIIYRYIKPKIIEGIDVPEFSGGIKVTNLERTVLDSIKDMDWIAGSEEVIANIESILQVNEDRLVRYLEQYNNQFLYQKTGYILQQYQGQLNLSDSFFSLCKEKSGKSTRYISKDYKKGKFISEWNLIVPELFFQMKNGELLNADV